MIPDPATRRHSFLRGVFLLGLGVVMFAVGAKLALVQLYGTDQPFADQWAAEGMYFLRGPLYYAIDLTQITSFHGEHRPALTRLWVRGLILANDGQWDCYVELVANLLIYAAFLAVVWRWVVSVVAGRGLIVAAACMAALFSLPCAYENFLWGFQSQFLFLLLLGAWHISGTLTEMRIGPSWVFAQVAGFLALFSIAAGEMSAAALVAFSAIRLMRRQNRTWAWCTFVVNTALFAFGCWLLPDGLNPPGNLFTRLGQAILSMGYLMSWPFENFWAGVLVHAPWVILLVNALLRPGGEKAARERLLGAMGLWVACIAFAIGYGRGVNAENIGVRYYDVLLLGVFVNVPALIVLVCRQTGRRRILWSGIGLAWVAVLSAGFWHQNRPENLHEMFKYQRGLAIEQRQVLRDFLVSDDPTQLQEFENKAHRFPHFEITLQFLRDPKVPPLLPPTLTPDGHENKLSRLSRRVASRWMLVMAIGLVCALVGAIRGWRGPSARTGSGTADLPHGGF